LNENQAQLPEHLVAILEKLPPVAKIEPDNVEIEPLTNQTKELAVAGAGRR
jgi:hypothetical protein